MSLKAFPTAACSTIGWAFRCDHSSFAVVAVVVVVVGVVVVVVVFAVVVVAAGPPWPPHRQTQEGCDTPALLASTGQA